jgi:phosphopantetheinyl transferase
MILEVKAITGTPDELLAQLDHKAWYEPALARMGTQRRREWLTVRVLLKKMLGGEERQILYTDSGKPYLADSSCKIGISHTKGYAAVALDRDHPVAIDIEYISPRVEKIRRRFMNETETENLSQNHPLIHLLLHWSAKETLFKYLNEANIDFKSQLHIHPFEPVIGEWGICTAHETKTDRKLHFTLNYRVEASYVIVTLEEEKQ